MNVNDNDCISILVGIAHRGHDALKARVAADRARYNEEADEPVYGFTTPHPNHEFELPAEFEADLARLSDLIISSEETPAMTNLIPSEIAVYATSLNSSAIRRPHNVASIEGQFSPDAILSSVPLLDGKVKVAVSTRLKANQFKVNATCEWDFNQVGRAVAMMPHWTVIGFHNDWHYMESEDGKRVGVKFPTTEDAMARIIFKDEIGRWQEHPMQRGIEATVVGDRTSIHGSTKEFKDMLRAAGGKWNRGAMSWDFEGELPVQVHVLLNTSFLTKYHYLVWLISDKNHRVFMQRGELFTENQGYALIVDGFQREAWRIAGYDWRSFPAIDYIIDPIVENIHDAEWVAWLDSLVTDHDVKVLATLDALNDTIGNQLVALAS